MWEAHLCPAGALPAQQPWLPRPGALAAGSEMPRTACGAPQTAELTPSAHPSSQSSWAFAPWQTRLQVPGALGERPRRSRPQAGAPRPHREHGPQDPRAALWEGRPLARGRPVLGRRWAQVQAANCPSLSVRLESRRLTGPHPPTPLAAASAAGCPQLRPGAGCPGRRGEHLGLEKSPMSGSGTHKQA